MMKTIDIDSFPSLAVRLRRPFHKDYYAMYSSVYEGIVTDPALMLVPVDDHLVHRGDGVFETMKCVRGNIYNMDAHLDRLKRSARALGYGLPGSLKGIRRIVVDTARAGNREDCMIRVLISRGPGSLAVNPYDCPEPGLYVIIARLNPPFMRMHPGGASAISSAIPVKRPVYARAKNCNYLPNALMKKEAVDKHADFAAGFDDDGHLAEGATENIGIVTRNRELLFPKLDRILRGTTMARVLELASDPVRKGRLKRAGYADIGRQEIGAAAEMMAVGTTLDVVAVTRFDGKPVGTGKPGIIAGKLNAMLRKDILVNKALQTPVFATSSKR